MIEQICVRCRRVCFSAEEFANHPCFDMDDKLNAEIALANWDGKLPGETESNANVAQPFRGILNRFSGQR